MSTASITPAPRTQPVWRPLRRLNRAGIPEKFRPWLFDPASLTERIVQHCPRTFRVRLLSQTRARPLRNEVMALGMRFGSHAMVRQVQLECGDTSWVYARTIIPPFTLARKFQRFTRLGTRSLGTLLFTDPSMERGEVEVTRLMPSDRLFHRVTRDLRQKPEEIWGRRSLFRLGGKPLLVCEFFLPGIAEF
ncbi:MAG: chorismate--pyruvate lyase family protein [Sulfuricaulis sp.]